MNTEYKITVGIISYNRPLELYRTINSLLPIPACVEVIICDDRSPKINEIKTSIGDLLKYNNDIKFIINESNLGYDRNLYKIFELATSKKVLLLGDDDYLEQGAIQNILSFFDKNPNFYSGFISYKDLNNTKSYRNYLTHKEFNKDTLQSNGSFLYNSILFSGLIFNKDEVLLNEKLLKKYFHSIYIQVAIFSLLSIKHGTYFINGPGVIIGGDGESGFGSNQASCNLDADLKDRTSIISNISYHKRLFEVIRNIDKDINKNISKSFFIEYKIRSIKALFNARKNGRKHIHMYWKELKKLDLNNLWLLLPIYYVIYLLPYNILEWPIDFIENKIYKYRNYK